MSVAFFFMGLRWRALMPPGHHPPAAGLTAIICAGLLLNYAVPGPFGELGAAWFAHKRYGLTLSSALASGVTARVVGLASAATLALVAWLVSDLPVPAGYEKVVALSAALLGAGGLLLAWLAARPHWWKAIAHALLARVGGTGRPGRLARRLEGTVSTVFDALAEVATRGPRAYAWATAWAVSGHLVVTLGIFIVAASVGAHPTPAGIVFTYATTTAGAVALFALPGSQVGWDAMFFTLMVATAGLAVPDALAVVLAVRVQQLLIMGVGAGALAWLMRGGSPPGCIGDEGHPGGPTHLRKPTDQCT